MDVFLMVRRKRCSLFTDAKENTSVYELKKIVEGVTKVSPENQKLFKDDMEMLDSKCLGDYSLTSTSARAQQPATVGLAYRCENGEFENLEVAQLSSPPELPEVMKPQDSNTHDQN